VSNDIPHQIYIREETYSTIVGGTESLGITAGETKNPSKNMPRVVNLVFWRWVHFDYFAHYTPFDQHPFQDYDFLYSYYLDHWAQWYLNPLLRVAASTDES
jgi:hypothetical protein